MLSEARAGAGAACIDDSVTSELIPVADGSGWFAKFRCNTKDKYRAIALGYLVPGLLVWLLLVFAAFGRARAK